MISAEEIQIIALSLKVAFLSTLFTLPLAIGLSWFLARKKWKGKALVEGILSLPLVAPPVVTGYLLLLLVGRNGLIGKPLYEMLGLQFSFNFAALVLASIVVSLPLAIRAMRSAFELIDPVYEKASRTLGASKLQTFFRISLPLAMPGIISGMVLSFARSLGEFGASITLAGNIAGKTQTISLAIYSNMQIPGKEMQITRLVVFSLLVSMLAIVFSEIIKKKNSHR